MKKIRNHKLVFTILLLIAGWFWWFQLRPSNIRSGCYDQARTNAINKLDNKEGSFKKSDFDAYYEFCLKEKGLK